METPSRALTANLLQDAMLLTREATVAKVNAVFDDGIKELCIRTRYPKEAITFVVACLASRGELETGAGKRSFFVRDREVWFKQCKENPGTILIAGPEMDFEGSRQEFLQAARSGKNSVIYSSSNPRPDTHEIIDLPEPKRMDVEELLKRHNYPQRDAERLAKRCNGNIHILTQLLSGTNERRSWANKDTGYSFRSLALIGGWDDSCEPDRNALNIIIGEQYDAWVQRLYALTRGDEPPVILEGRSFRPVARYETWQQLGYYLTDADLSNFAKAAIKVLGETDSRLELPKGRMSLGEFGTSQARYSASLRSGLAETLALLAGQYQALQCTPTLPVETADHVVYELLNNASWKMWASLSDVMPLLAEASPNVFLSALERALKQIESSPLKMVFERSEEMFWDRTYHPGILWALEVLAWNPDYISRVCICLARLANYKISRSTGNNPLGTLTNILLPWIPQTLASVEGRRIAVEKVLEENPEVGWKLIMSLLPETHQVGGYNQKPVWQDWFPSEWKDGVTRGEYHRQVKNYAHLAMRCALASQEKLTEIIGKWDHLPREVFQQMLVFLESDEVVTRSEEDRFILWDKLIGEVKRHRRFAESDWAMPEEETKALERVAESLKPSDPLILYRRFFNHRDFDLLESKNTADELPKLQETRTNAASEIWKMGGVHAFLELSKVVNFPSELGMALGRSDSDQIDKDLLPTYLEQDNTKCLDAVYGFAWSRYFCASKDWLDKLNIVGWGKSHQIRFLSALPFEAKVWRFAAAVLGDDVIEYWASVRANPYQAKENLPEAISLALAYNRADIAIAGIVASIYSHISVSAKMAVDALKAFAKQQDQFSRISGHDLVEIVQYLHKTPDVDPDEMLSIELQFLPLLDYNSGGAPKFLELKMATDPHFFHEIIKTCFHSEHEKDKPNTPDPSKVQKAEHLFGLMFHWRTPPGTTRERTIDENALGAFISKAKQLCELSGHWTIAQQRIGHAFAYEPAGLEGLLKYQEVARTLDLNEFDQMRVGFQLELFNQRGVHGFSHGQDELKLARQYRERAAKFEAAKFTRVAATLLSLAETYEREAKREESRDPYR